MADVIEVLEQDHRLVERLFEEYRTSNDAGVAGRICEELIVHTKVEEELVYPVLASDVDDGEELEHEARQEHDEVEDLIEQLRAAGLDSEEAPELVSSLQAAVEHHVEEEESEILPKLRAALESSRLDELGAEVERFKHENGGSPRSHGEATRSSSRGSSPTASSSRGSARSGDDEPTKQELYEQARAEGIEGRSTMSKDELAHALERVHKAS